MLKSKSLYLKMIRLINLFLLLIILSADQARTYFEKIRAEPPFIARKTEKKIYIVMVK